MRTDLNLVKQHLIVEHELDDTYITHLIQAAEIATENYIDAPLSDFGEEIPKAVTQAVLLMVGHFYANREPVAFATANKIPFTIEFLLQPYKTYGIA